MRKKLLAIVTALLCMLVPVTAFASEKTMTNDFDENTNQTYSIDHLTFEVPASWEYLEDDSDILRFYFTNGMLQVQSSVFVGNILDENYRTIYINNILSDDESNITNFSSSTLHLDGCDKDFLFCEFSCTLDDTDLKEYRVVSSFEDDTHMITFALFDYDDSELDHSDDYYAVLNSIAFSEEDTADYETMFYDFYEQYYQLLDDYDTLVANTGADIDDEYESKTEEQDVAISSDEMTMGEKNALDSAESYLSFSSFSYTGLIDQLEYEGYTTEEAIFAADNCGADWYEQAVASAESYLSFSSFSRDGLISQLEYEGFTTEQAEYAVNAVGY